ncbi:hypothetical protein J4E91_009765 [Alternaria rosae]|nr:hypothetical protein J4E91_009765 [Alternaria rosae]
MDPPDQTVDSGGGAIFQGDITAGRDITINQITEIRQVSERLSSRYSEADNSDKLLGSLEALSAFAKYTEDYAKMLDTSVFSSDLHFGRVSQECASILRELKVLVEPLEQGELGRYELCASLSDNVIDLRSRLTSLQSHLNVVSNRKTAKDYETIKETLTQLVNSHNSTDKAFSIRSFVTAPSIRSFPAAPSIRSFVTASSIRSFVTTPEIPDVEQQVWLDIERSLRAVGFTTDFVGKNRDLIVASLEDVFLENTAAWIVEGAKLKDSPSEYTAPTLQLSETYNIAITRTDGGEKIDNGTSSHSVYNEEPSIADKLAVEWSESVKDGTGECLLTLDGGGVKSWSSLLIIEALMKEVIAFENRFERQFTHYPRSFEASNFRPCHYFHKMYGTSTGGHYYNPDTLPPWVLTYNEDTPDLRTWQVGRATTAAPFFFKPLEVMSPNGSLTFKDGGIRENNPSFCAYSEAASFWGDDSEPALLLSIGAGQTSSNSDDTSLAAIIPFGLSTLRKFAKRTAVLKNTLIKYTEGQSRHRTMRTIAKGENRWYKRFEVTHGLEKMRADEWEHVIVPGKGEDGTLHFKDSRTLETIRTATEVYLNRQEADKSVNEYTAPREKLKQTAEKLVRMRRARELEAMTQGGEKRKHWEAFMGKHLPGEREFFRKYQEEWDYALLGRKH